VKIALIGYGKMGHMIEEIAAQRGHEIVLKISSSNIADLTVENLQKADAAIEFTRPDAALDNMCKCFEAGTPVVVGTTGWQGRMPEMEKKCMATNGSIVYGSNFSVGVNMLFSLNETLSRWMKRFPEYKVDILEVHHKQKLDAPSGTAITLAEGVIRNIGRLKSWIKLKKGDPSPADTSQLPVFYSREDGVPGYHEVDFTSAIDKIRLSHEAFNRKGFALGAVLAAEFIRDRKGIYTAKEIFKFESL
jgi:4-hydroxy-tetrahydrodipicolinate reductase